MSYEIKSDKNKKQIENKLRNEKIKKQIKNKLRSDQFEIIREERFKLRKHKQIQRQILTQIQKERFPKFFLIKNRNIIIGKKKSIIEKIINMIFFFILYKNYGNNKKYLVEIEESLKGTDLEINFNLINKYLNSIPIGFFHIFYYEDNSYNIISNLLEKRQENIKIKIRINIICYSCIRISCFHHVFTPAAPIGININKKRFLNFFILLLSFFNA